MESDPHALVPMPKPQRDAGVQEAGSCGRSQGDQIPAWKRGVSVGRAAGT